MCRLVSVIVPTYNRAYCLQRTLNSVLGQSHQHFEVILIDDGSTDETRDLIARIYGNDSRIRYYYQKNQGVTAARNQGLARIRGDYIALLDSDDVWLPFKLELQLACFEQCPELGMVWTDMQAIGPQGDIVSQAYLRTMYHAYRWFKITDLFAHSYLMPAERLLAGGARLHVGEIFSQMVMGNLVHTSTVMLRRERLEKVRGFNENLRMSGEDYDFHLRTCREGPVGFIDVASIQYQTGLPDRLSGKAFRTYTSQNCLTTVLPHLQNGRTEVRLSRTMRRSRLAEIYQWVGDALLENGQPREARRHLLKSLWYRPLQGRTAALLVRSVLPVLVGTGLRHGWRRLKSILSCLAA
jgi:glycosyltransferase involved in cell wall biosynthesis